MSELVRAAIRSPEIEQYREMAEKLEDRITEDPGAFLVQLQELRANSLELSRLVHHATAGMQDSEESVATYRSYAQFIGEIDLLLEMIGDSDDLGFTLRLLCTRKAFREKFGFE